MTNGHACVSHSLNAPERDWVRRRETTSGSQYDHRPTDGTGFAEGPGISLSDENRKDRRELLRGPSFPVRRASAWAIHWVRPRSLLKSHNRGRKKTKVEFGGGQRRLFQTLGIEWPATSASTNARYPLWRTLTKKICLSDSVYGHAGLG